MTTLVARESDLDVFISLNRGTSVTNRSLTGPDTTRLFVVLNPVAGNYHADIVGRTLKERFDKNNICYDVYETTGKENLAAIVETALSDNYSMIVAGGGDGTVSEIAAGLLNSDTPLGILPLGTGNLVARELGIPLEIDDACQLLVSKNTITYLDAMQVDHQVSMPHISLGVHARLIENTSVEEKRRFGMMAYFGRALREISRRRQAWTFTIAVDDQKQYARASLILVANIGVVGIGDSRWGENIRPDDGEIDICIIRAKTATDYLSVLWYLLRRQPKPAQITYLRAKKEITVTANRPVPVRIGGKTVEQSAIHIKVIPQSIKAIVPLQRERVMNE